MGPFGSPQTQPCSWQLLALAQPPASCRLISRLHGSFGELFFEAVDAFWGPSLALGRQTKALTRQDMGPRRFPPIHFRPQQKRYSLLPRHGSPLHRLHRRIALANGKVVIFAFIFIKRHESSARCRHHQNIKTFLTGRLLISWRGCRTGCSSSTSQRCQSGVVHLEAGNGARLDPSRRRQHTGDPVHARLGRLTGTRSMTGTMSACPGHPLSS